LGSQKKIKSGQAATKGVVESSSWHGINGFTIRLNCRDDASRCTSGNGLMKFAVDRPYSDPEKAARKLIEIANSVDAVQDGRIYIEKINGPFLFEFKGSPDEYRAALKLAIDRGGFPRGRTRAFDDPLPALSELLPRIILTFDSAMLGDVIRGLWSGPRVSSGHRRTSGSVPEGSPWARSASLLPCRST
jgi:hypothetical protein